MDNKRRKLFVIKQSKWCKFSPKMHQNTFGGRDLSGPAVERIISPPRTPSRNGWPTSKGRKGKKEGDRGGRGGDLLVKGGMEREGSYF